MPPLEAYLRPTDKPECSYPSLCIDECSEKTAVPVLGIEAKLPGEKVQLVGVEGHWSGSAIWTMEGYVWPDGTGSRARVDIVTGGV